MQAVVPPKLQSIETISDLLKHFPTEKDVAHMLFDEGLIKKEMTCGKCGKMMTLRSRGATYEWRCRISKAKDCSSKSIKSDSFFSTTKLNLMQAVKIMVLWNKQLASKQIAAEAKVSQNTVCDWRNFLRELCVQIESSYGMIGGSNHVVEIDESNVHSRKYGKGKGIVDTWVFGGIDRDTGRVFAQRVPNRTATTLVPLLQANVDRNSIVYSDEWRSYSQLKKYFSQHFTVQHKTQFVNLVAGRKVCTNGIENFWGRLKKPFKAMNGTSDALLDSYISESVVRENENTNFFPAVLGEIKKLAE